jgi:hypothetical protein
MQPRLSRLQRGPANRAGRSRSMPSADSISRAANAMTMRWRISARAPSLTPRTAAMPSARAASMRARPARQGDRALQRGDPQKSEGRQLLSRARQRLQLSRQVQASLCRLRQGAGARLSGAVPARNRLLQSRPRLRIAAARRVSARDRRFRCGAEASAAFEQRAGLARRGVSGSWYGPEAVADYKAALAIDPKNERAREGLSSLGQPLP